MLTGARQVGKTSILRREFPDHAFASLDIPSVAERDLNAVAESMGSDKVLSRKILCRSERSFPLSAPMDGAVQAVSYRDAWFEGDGE